MERDASERGSRAAALGLGGDARFLLAVEDEDAALVARARLGDEDAFAALYRRNIGHVRAIGVNILHDASVDDFCQDTFLLAFTRLHSFTGRAKFRTWLTRIAINQCMMSLRGRRHLVPLEEADTVLDGCFYVRTDAALKGAPARMDLEKMMKILKPTTRRLLVMSYLEGVPELEIAEILGMSRVTVANRLRRAKRLMRDTFS